MSNKTALITGASSGIGQAFARLLAVKGYDLILTARREERLATLCAELEKSHNVKALYVVADLADPDSPQRIYEYSQKMGINVDLLINNAGFGRLQSFKDIDDGQNHSMIQVLISSLTELTRLFLRPMLDRDKGGILNVASIGADVSAPGFAVYAASKAYVVHFTDCLAMELMGTGVTATVVLPGATRTEFSDVAGMRFNKALDMVSMDAEKVATLGYKAWLKGKVKYTVGCLNRVQVYLMRMMPRCCAKKMVSIYTQ